MPPTNRKRSGNPAVAAAARDDDKYAPTTWLSNGPLGGSEDLVLPSGQLALVRRPGVEGLMKAGVLRNLDSLTDLVSKNHVARANGRERIDVEGLLGDEERMAEITHVMDRVITHCVLKPQIEMAPNDVTNRQPGVVYTDMIDLTDKAFVFNFVVGGTRDLETFRNGLNELSRGVAVGPDLPDEAE